MRAENLEHIKSVFEAKTSVTLKRTAYRKKAALTVLLAACLAFLMTISAYAAGLFNSLEGDDLAIKASYDGEGIVNLRIENRSDKELRLQPKLQLRRWSTGEDVEKLSGEPIFSATLVPAKSSAEIEIDLSPAYDMALLEKTMEGDGYYFVLTNNDFLFGQDWICTVQFAGSPENEARSKEMQQENGQNTTLQEDTAGKNKVQLSRFAGTVVCPVKPGIGSLYVDGRPDPRPSAPFTLFDTSKSIEGQAESWGTELSHCDASGNLLGTAEDYARVVSLFIPNPVYPESLIAIPVIYLFFYEKADALPENYGYIRGQLIRFDQLEERKVYEDERYVCYDISSYIYTDLDEYIACTLSGCNAWPLDDDTLGELHETYAYLKEKLPELIMDYDTYLAFVETER